MQDEPSSSEPSAPESGPRHRAQFGMRTMMGLMLLFSVLAAVFGGMIQGGRQQQTFVVIGVAAPMGLMILISIGHQVARVLKKRRKP